MAVVARGHVGRDIGPAERHRLAVVRVAIAREPVLVAAAAYEVALRLEVPLVGGRYLVRAVAVRAPGPRRSPLARSAPWTLWL